MAAEQIKFPNALQELTAAIGNAAIPKQVELSSNQTIQINRVPLELVTDQSGSRKVTVAANLIKEKFMNMDKNLSADNRQEQRAQLRAASVRKTFKLFGMIPNDASVDEPFEKLYEASEASAPTIDRSHLADLAETHEQHPAIQVFDALNATSAMSADDIVYMRRASLLLIDRHSS